MISFWIPGTPKAQGSKKIVMAGGKNKPRRAMIIEDNPHGHRTWRNAVEAACWTAVPGLREKLSCPVSVKLDFLFERPKSHYLTKDGKPTGELRPGARAEMTTKPDLDKLARAVIDSITAVLLADDSQVICLSATKKYGPAGEDPGVQVIMEIL
jgi:crossover junction endodeoxyribonuclease RusA